MGQNIIKRYKYFLLYSIVMDNEEKIKALEDKNAKLEEEVQFLYNRRCKYMLV
jgi:hypothetical protein